ncbi:hypothetical protein [Stappia indica]|uniref:hypothetical protein n=1 Tax=Stappia indica TaxID=538381 RepID=UPI001D197B0A|nr:hypothetical protein [Stappia indica]MCC4243411.1 hypothetical protein [Stappia indica]
MNITEIDVDSYATRVAFVAASELYALLSEGEGSDFMPACADEVALQQLVENTGAFIIAHGVEKGETVWLWLQQDRRATRTPWAAVPEEQRFALDLFAITLRDLRQRLAIRQIEAERRASLPPPNPAPAIEDTIFEPVGSLGEMEPWAAEAAASMARFDREQAAERELQRKAEIAAQEAAEAAEREAAKPARAAKLSAGKAAPKPQPKDQPKDLPKVPNRQKPRGKAPASG